MHPRREPWGNNGAGVGELRSPKDGEAPGADDNNFAASARTGVSSVNTGGMGGMGISSSGIPLYVGRAQSPVDNGRSTGRLSRLKAWASSLPAKMRGRSASPRGEAPQRQDSWSSFGSEAPARF